MQQTQTSGLSISVKSFLTAILVIFALMIGCYLLTLVIPGGSYGRILDGDGNLVVDTASCFSYIPGGIPLWKWILSPLLVLFSSGSGTLIAVIVFLLVIGGVFNALDKCGLMHYILNRTAARFMNVRHRLMAIIVLFFMSLGAMIGSFEECVPLVPLVVALSIHLGWDALTGVGMSLLAAGCGFAAGVCNPFTVGVAQQLAGLPMFSGVWLRIVSFVLIYLLLMVYLSFYTRRIERPLPEVQNTLHFQPDQKMDRGMVAFVGLILAGILIVLSSAFITVLQDYTMIIVAVMFLVSGVAATLLCQMRMKALAIAFLEGIAGILPAVVMILMASSIKYTLEEAKIMDTILYGAVNLAKTMPDWAVILFIYAIVLVMNFFIPSGSAKAFMLIPLIVPMAQIFGISSQLCVTAFAFGDGFSNVIYPTNPALLISLGLVDISYSDWFKWSAKFQILNLILTGSILIFGLRVGY